MIIENLSSGETKYTKIEKVFSLFNFSLLKIESRYKSQSMWHTNYKIKRVKNENWIQDLVNFEKDLKEIL